MSYDMFLDDERFPPAVGKFDRDWYIVRTVPQAKQLIEEIGWPRFISFDHDLGAHTETGYDLVKWLIEEDLTHGWIPANFDFAVHSMNPIGAENIQKALDAYLRYKGM